MGSNPARVDCGFLYRHLDTSCVRTNIKSIIKIYNPTCKIFSFLHCVVIVKITKIHSDCSLFILRPKTMSPVSGHRAVGFKICAVTRFLGVIKDFLGHTGKYVIHVYAGTKFPIYKVWWLREASQIGQTFIHYAKSRLKNSTTEFQSIQQF